MASMALSLLPTNVFVKTNKLIGWGRVSDRVARDPYRVPRGDDRRRQGHRFGASSILRGAGPGPREVPGGADRLSGVLPGRDAHGVRLSQVGAGSSGGVRASQVPDAGSRGPPVPLAGGSAG